MNVFAGHLTLGLVSIAAILFTRDVSAAELLLRWLEPNGEIVAEKTLTTEEIEALPQREFTTNTPWTERPTTFTGPAFADLVGLADRPVASAHVVALNDYAADIPADGWTKEDPILAVRVGGDLMKIRDKGPFWLVYPIDDDPEIFDSELYRSRMVWQVKSIDFLVQ